MANSDPPALESEASTYRRCFLAGLAILLGALGGEAASRSGTSASAQQPCPFARVAAVDRVAQLKPEILLLQVGGMVGRAIVSELRGD